MGSSAVQSPRPGLPAGGRPLSGADPSAGLVGGPGSASWDAGPPADVAVALYPHPYRAMMAICSDLDGTPDLDVYGEIVRFLNTTETTAMGPGVGLEVGNSIFFAMPPDQFSYDRTDEAGREVIRTLIRSGHIDCLHSYGDEARTRRDVERILAELDRHRCVLPVWVDHSKAPTNFGPDIMRGSGDVPAAPAYHADLTLAHGVRYVWRGRTTSILGQQAPVSIRALAALLHRRHPLASGINLVKHVVKLWLGRRGDSRWQMHTANRAYRPARLRDGQRVWEFLRSNPHWAGPGAGDTAEGVAAVLTDAALDRLVRRAGVCILYTHLGKIRDRRHPFSAPTVAALRRLASRRDEGQILVTTTHRLLRYLTVRDTLRVQAWRRPGRLAISLGPVQDPVRGDFMPTIDDLMGLTLVTERSPEITVNLADGSPVPCDVAHRDGAAIVTVPWRPLRLPELR